MSQSERGQFLITDARSLLEDALEMLSQGRLRNAAEKAWGATKRATDALILERTGREPARTAQTSSGLKALAREIPEIAPLRRQFDDRVRYLHSQCFYNGNCEPEAFITGLVYDTADYIRDAENLADSRNQGGTPVLATKRAKEMMAEAWSFYVEAIQLLEQGDLRNAAGKAWDASEKATVTLVFEKTGREPQFVRDLSVEVAYLGQESESHASFRSRFAGQVEDLYGDCYVDNHCDPEDYHEDMIRNTDSFIREAERLSG